MTRFQALTLSLLIHGALYLGISLVIVLQPYFDQIKPKSTQNVRFQPIQNDKMMTLILDNEEKNEANNEPAKYLAKNKSRVKNETQAPRIADSANRKLTANDLTPKFQDNTKAKSTSDNGLVTQELKNQKSNKKNNMGLSSLQLRLPEKIKNGEFTSLNADAHLYYSFFSRIAPRIRFYWEQGVEGVVESLTFRKTVPQEERTFTTEVEVQLTEEGNLIQTLIYRSSGYKPLDEAVLRAFSSSAPFVHPPKEMIEKDGIIRLYYGFNVYYSPKVLAKSL